MRRSGGRVGGGCWRGGSSASSSSVAAVISCTARSKAASVRGEVDCTPLTLRTYWRAAAVISSGVASGSRPLSVVMFRHMDERLRARASGGDNGVVLGHLGLNVPDLAAARAYYGEILPLLDYEPFLTEEEGFAYQPAGAHRGTYLFFYPAPAGAPYDPARSGLQHLAFVVPTRTRVRAVHQAVLGLGNGVVHAPREFPQYPPPYFATFWRDPFGFMLEAVCHHDRV
jgi:catechol 2,3-dioxygenase-like lactoylglutathione lyase family enzyme